MQCLIIAAGQGTRLRSLAPSKPLAQLHGTPLIEHIVRLAAAGGATGFTIVTGYEGERIEAFLPGLAARTGVPVEAVRNPDWERPNGVSVLAAAPRLDADFLLLMSDHLFDPAIVAGLLAGRAPGAALTLAADRDIASPLLDLDDATKIMADGDDHIVRIGKTIPEYNAIDTGIFHATQALFAALRFTLAAGGAGSLSEGVQRLADDKNAYIHDIGTRWWVDVDDAPAFRRAERELPLLRL